MTTLRRILPCFFALAALTPAVFAAAPRVSRNGNAVPGASRQAPAAPEVIGATSITQSTNATTVTAGSVSCNGGAPRFLHTDNSYFRAFTLSAFNPPLDQTQFMVQSVTFGIETVERVGHRHHTADHDQHPQARRIRRRTPP